MTDRSLLLASASRYKREQLQRLGLHFEVIDPRVDEDHELQANPQYLAELLAQQKAAAVAKFYPAKICIGSDQTAQTGSSLLLTKPGSVVASVEQLMNCSGQTASFFSAMCLYIEGKAITWSVETKVKFRRLTLDECQRYVTWDNPIDCAGSFKVESLGISLFESIESTDPTALVGLPLISLCNELRKLGVAVP